MRLRRVRCAVVQDRRTVKASLFAMMVLHVETHSRASLESPDQDVGMGTSLLF